MAKLILVSRRSFESGLESCGFSTCRQETAQGNFSREGCGNEMDIRGVKGAAAADDDDDDDDWQDPSGKGGG